MKYNAGVVLGKGGGGGGGGCIVGPFSSPFGLELACANWYCVIATHSTHMATRSSYIYKSSHFANI